MRKFKKVIIYSILILSTNTIYSQNVVRFYNEYHKNQLLKGIKERYKTVEGTPYMYGDFLSGDVRVERDQTYIYKALIRYNMYMNEMEFKDESGQVYLLKPPEGMKEIVLNDKTFIHSDFIENGESGDSYFLRMNDGHYKFLIRKKVVLLEAEREEPYKPARPARFHQEEDKYFVKKDDSPAFYLKKVNKLKDIFPEKRDVITKYLKSNKVRTRDLESLIKLFEHINKD